MSGSLPGEHAFPTQQAGDTAPPPYSSLPRLEKGTYIPGPKAGPGPLPGFLSAGLCTNSSRPCWHPQLTFISFSWEKMDKLKTRLSEVEGTAFLTSSRW